MQTLPSSLQIANLARAYGDRYSTQQSADDPSTFHVYESVSKLVATEPRRALEMIIFVLDNNPSDFCISNLAAGPLEDVLSLHGDLLIDQIETEAKRNPKFDELLGGVYFGRLSSIVADRVLKVRSSKWHD